MNAALSLWMLLSGPAQAADIRPVPVLQETGPTVTLVSPALESPGGQQVSGWALTHADRTAVATSAAWTPTRRLRLHTTGVAITTPTWIATDLTAGATLGILQVPHHGLDLALVPELTWTPRLGSVQSFEARLALAAGGRTATRGWNLMAGAAADTGQDAWAEAGAAGRARLFSRLWLVGEVRGGYGLAGDAAGLQPIHTALAVTVRASDQATALLFTDVSVDPGTLDWTWRAGLGVRARRIGLPPDVDRDHVSNRRDACTLTAEDVDGTSDLDGCPELDDDLDGLADAQDQCPTEAEDLDGHADADGCPDPDNDQDGVLEPEDQCPDLSGLPELGGCPDGDGDQVVDALDACPADKGTAAAQGCPDWDTDGVPDPRDRCPQTPVGLDAIAAVSDGCPAALRLGGAQVYLPTSMLFDGADTALATTAEPGLAELAALLKAHPAVHLVILGDGTDTDLARARAVRDSLTAGGRVSRGRVTLEQEDDAQAPWDDERIDLLLLTISGY